MQISNNPLQFLQIDEEGFFVHQNVRYNDVNSGARLLKNLRYDGRALKTFLENPEHLFFVESFNAPYVVQSCEVKEAEFILNLPYELSFSFKGDFYLDEWDRLCGFANDIPFVFSRSAQTHFFDSADEYDDDSFIFNGKTFKTKPWLSPSESVNKSQFWSDKYLAWQDESNRPGWDLGGPATALRSVSAQIKLNRCRIAVLGCGSGYDAAFFAEQGHFVTAFDFSSEAISRAQKNFSHLKNINFVVADALNLPQSFYGQFDVVFEHTFFCAIDPGRRKDAIRAYKRLLADGGHLLGLFFILNPSVEPPFGLTEWELREYLKADFQPLYWTRWRQSIDRRLGQELVVYARIKERL